MTCSFHSLTTQKKEEKSLTHQKKRIKSFAHLSHLLCVILLSLSYRGLYPPRKSISSNLFLFDAFQSSVHKNTAQPTHCTSCEIIKKFVLRLLKQVNFDTIAKNKAKSENVFCMWCVLSTMCSWVDPFFLLLMRNHDLVK